MDVMETIDGDTSAKQRPKRRLSDGSDEQANICTNPQHSHLLDTGCVKDSVDLVKDACAGGRLKDIHAASNGRDDSELVGQQAEAKRPRIASCIAEPLRREGAGHGMAPVADGVADGIAAPCGMPSRAGLPDELEDAKELAKQRLEHVLAEMDGHMEKILRQRGQDVLSQWLSADVATEDRRELYVQLVHSGAKEAVEVECPKELATELLPHQFEGLEWLASLFANGLHGVLADEMGLGKTVQTIALLLHLQEARCQQGPHLVVAPKSTLSNWQSEFARFAPCFPVHVLTGSPSERRATLEAVKASAKAKTPVVCITNYEQVHRNETLISMAWKVVVVDEGHRLKNPKTVVHAAMARLSCEMRLLLTGTPVQNELNELWALLHYLLPKFFTTGMDFKEWFSRPFRGNASFNEFLVQLDAAQEQQVVCRMHELLAPFLLQRLKCEVLAAALPPKVEVDIIVPLSAWQQSAYRDLEQRTIRLMDGAENVSSELVSNTLMQMRKVVLHPLLFQDGYDADAGLIRFSGKAEALDRLLRKLLPCGHKVLVFSQFTTMLDILEDLLHWRGIRSVRLDGQVAHLQRQERLKQFAQDSETRVFLLSTRAGGLGLNLQAADTVVLFDIDWNPQNDRQAVARVHRVGQTREVRVVRLIADAPVEHFMVQRCQEKLEMEAKIMGAGMFRKAASAEQRRQALRAVLGLNAVAEESVGEGESSGERSSAPRATLEKRLTEFDELNNYLARHEEELQSFRAIDQQLLQLAQGETLGPTLQQQDRNGSAQVEPSPGDVLGQLVHAGRLMGEAEVPRGFTITGGNGEGS